ncbi:hypothetical protein D9611_004406 [Ephemerocybe angulata]|uniref:Major facilitator superfamily (MFS) profile domain-containing protein n=1 Tax=Ephemerocybe angulata TaxID=980116 RepID=A0A8H5BJW7_9AGAR|nr:hypothetical protein D9611_004406 [Tulosesus angulatus]
MTLTLFNRIRPRADVPAVVDEQRPDSEAPVDGRSLDEKAPSTSSVDQSSEDEAQDGVRKVEAVTAVWTKTTLIIVYALILLIYFIDSMQQAMTNSLTPFVTSSFGKHSLLGVTSIVSSIVGGLVKLPLAKVLDIWGRPQGYLAMVVCLTIGLIMMAACNNVKTYAAAQVFYWVGYNGLTYTLGIFIADTSKLRNRAFMFAYASSPYLATTWIGGPLATAIMKGPGFRWGFGIFAIVTPAVTLPLYFIFLFNQRKAEKLNLGPKKSSGRTTMESIYHYSVEFDVVGLFLITVGLALFLLPFSLYSYQKDGWRSGMIIAMIIIGGLLLIGFAIWERYFAIKTFIPYKLLTDRTLLGACILAGSIFISFYCWNAFFYSFLMVVNGLTVTEASYVSNTYTMGSCLWALVVGVFIRYTGRFKWLALYFGVPLTILGVGLMIHFRQPDTNIGYVVMCQIFIALAGGTLVICEQIAAMAATSHQYVAVVLALESMFSSIGGAIGATVATAIWTSTFPQQLVKHLPAGTDPLKVYGSIVVQLSYPPGTPERIAINRAYGYAQKCQCIAATAVLAVSLGAVMMWRDLKVTDRQQVKGVVI